MVLDSRDVAQMLGKQHKNLLRDIEGYISAISESSDLSFQVKSFFRESSYKVDGNNKTYKCYLLTKMGCEFVANKLTGAKGAQFTAAYVSKFNEMEQRQQVEATIKAFDVPTNLGDALLLAANFYKENEKLKEENLLLQAANEELEEEYQKANAFNKKIFSSKDLLTYTETAKLLELPPLKFIEYLRRRNLITKGNLPTSNGIKKGYCKIVASHYLDSEGNEHITQLPKVTLKGLDYFRKFADRHKDEINNIKLR